MALGVRARKRFSTLLRASPPTPSTRHPTPQTVLESSAAHLWEVRPRTVEDRLGDISRDRHGSRALFMEAARSRQPDISGAPWGCARRRQGAPREPWVQMRPRAVLDGSGSTPQKGPDKAQWGAQAPNLESRKICLEAQTPHFTPGPRGPDIGEGKPPQSQETQTKQHKTMQNNTK